MRFRILFVIPLTALLLACAAQPARVSDSKTPEPAAGLYVRLDAAVARYEVARSAAAAGNGHSMNGETSAALDELDAAASQCQVTRGCDSARFVAAFDRLLRASATAVQAQTTPTAAPDATEQAG